MTHIILLYCEIFADYLIEKHIFYKAASAAFFVRNNRNLCPNRLIDGEVDENGEAPAVCNQKTGESVPLSFSQVLSGYSDRRIFCLSVRIRLFADALFGKSDP